MRPIIAIVGPTGVGKTGFAVELAHRLNAEIVSADSRQVYRYMDIGTAKPTKAEMAQAPHHLIDIIDPDEDFGLAQYQDRAYRAIADIHAGGKVALLVGGTGQYVWAVLEGWQIPRVAPDTEFRKELEVRAAGGGAEALFAELTAVDPEAAGSIDPRNVRRVIRALEVSHTAGVPFSSLRRKVPPPFDTIMMGLTANRAELYCRTNARVDRMIESGLVQEVQNLERMGYGPKLPSMSGIGYRQIGQYLEGRLTLEAAIEEMKVETHRFIRHQYGWFRLKDPRIQWSDASKLEHGPILNRIRAWLAASSNP
jgi:tRNA dimethylallyltransferase